MGKIVLTTATVLLACFLMTWSLPCPNQMRSRTQQRWSSSTGNESRSMTYNSDGSEKGWTAWQPVSNDGKMGSNGIVGNGPKFNGGSTGGNRGGRRNPPNNRPRNTGSTGGNRPTNVKPGSSPSRPTNANPAGSRGTRNNNGRPASGVTRTDRVSPSSRGDRRPNAGSSGKPVGPANVAGINGSNHPAAQTSSNRFSRNSGLVARNPANNGQLTLMNLNDHIRGTTTDIITEVHNAYRRFVANPHTATHWEQPTALDMPDLVWDNALAYHAKTWAEKCVWDHSKSQFGENLAMETYRKSIYNTSSVNKFLRKFITRWFNEYRHFTYPNVCKQGEMCGHYTQIVWAQTTKLGCGYSKCNTLKGANNRYAPYLIFVCDYSPAGNVYDGTSGYKYPPYATKA